MTLQDALTKLARSMCSFPPRGTNDGRVREHFSLNPDGVLVIGARLGDGELRSFDCVVSQI